jgi:hypothetical protein
MTHCSCDRTFGNPLSAWKYAATVDHGGMCEYDTAATAGAEWGCCGCRWWGGPRSHYWRESGTWSRGWWCCRGWHRGALAGYHWGAEVLTLSGEPARERRWTSGGLPSKPPGPAIDPRTGTLSHNMPARPHPLPHCIWYLRSLSEPIICSNYPQ